MSPSQRLMSRRSFFGLGAAAAGVALTGVAQAAEPIPPVIDYLGDLWRAFDDPDGLPVQSLKNLLNKNVEFPNTNPQTLADQRLQVLNDIQKLIEFIDRFQKNLGKNPPADFSPQMLDHVREFFTAAANQIQTESRRNNYPSAIDTANAANATVFKKHGKQWTPVEDSWDLVVDICRKFTDFPQKLKNSDPAFDTNTIIVLVQEAVAQGVDIHANSLAEQRAYAAAMLKNIPNQLQAKLTLKKLITPRAAAMEKPQLIDAFYEFCLIAAQMVTATVTSGGSQKYLSPAQIAEQVNTQLANEYATGSIPQRAPRDSAVPKPSIPSPAPPSQPVPGVRLVPIVDKASPGAVRQFRI